MSERPTPETDAAQHEGLLRGNPMPTRVVHVNFARRLERERDEAREQIEVCRGIIQRTVIARNSALSDLTELERERDEAIRQRDETNESSVFSCNFYYEEKLKAERERDEARAVAGAMADIAFKHLTSLLATTPHSKDAEHNQETQQVIAAIKEWKKLKQ